MAISSANSPGLGFVDNWVQIATSTPTSGTTVSFTSIPANYRKLWLVTAGPITLSTSSLFSITVNSLTASNDYRGFKYISTGHSFFNDTAIKPHNSGSLYNFNMTFENPTNGLPFVKFEGLVATHGNTGTKYEGWVVNATTPITSLDITSSSGNLTTNSGVIYLYGTY